MAGVESRDFSNPDEVRRPERTTVELVKLAGGEIGRYTFDPGWRWSECSKPVDGTASCQVEHIGYVISGTLRVTHDDGTTAEITKGDVYRIGPGHDGEVVGDEPAVLVEFQGAANYARG
jgi:quercetin dioxygenase-like cupin family protein